MNIQMMEGLLGASSSIRLSGTPMSVYRQASTEGNTEKERPMEPISGVSAGAVQPLAAKSAKGISKVQKSEEETRVRRLNPAMDEYVPEKPAPEQGNGEDGKCVCNTDKADREIEQLKRKKAELAQRLSTETDEAEIRDLERRLAQVERELKQKDSDAYRKRHSTFTRLS